MGTPTARRAPLTGIRVLDLSRVLAGPWASQMLADLGADVVKVERPGQGDDTRHWGPPYQRDAAGNDTDMAAYFLCANRNKRSLTLDLTHAGGQALARELAYKADVVLENFKPGGLVKYGLDAASLRQLAPRLVYCSISGFGQTGPYAHRAGYDFLIQAMGGLMSVTGRADDETGAGPQKVGVALTDILTGLYATIAIQAALVEREHSGLGQHIDLALLDVQVACLANQASNYLAGGMLPQRMGNAHPNIVPYQDFPTADGDMILAIGNDGQFERFCTAAGHPEWASDPRFATNSQRVTHRTALIPLLRQATVMRTTDAWMALLESQAVPCGPINRLDAVFADPQVVARGLRIELPDAWAGSVPLVANPIRLSDTPVTYRLPPPRLGEHTQTVLAEWLGLDAERIGRLRDDAVI
ncbi:MAG: CaiB/BaiF CoA-transferase family protein [Rhodanobacter sp.]|jgi:crotonobetainyl-CoA:carnitine CoA-transferase CaiB-like acyl-CoA transferase|uniref:CaiB/BaiF CoA transferase family protein n=1 Tax=Rhodanobacter sp. KK11 TaxID=3083255 RepID=UPI0029663190|nr:CaiB/BaiF CoA-transferase family protein [Rhodanobacter sp. KK11]MDW2979919.1 CaiB/BaiF CoA-transferase family protein [Rhodanobacter sp. KK11]